MNARFRKAAAVLRAVGQALRLLVKVPGLLVLAAARYKAFRNAFVRAAEEAGMPAPLARELARAMRPGRMWKDWQGGRGEVAGTGERGGFAPGLRPGISSPDPTLRNRMRLGCHVGPTGETK